MWVIWLHKSLVTLFWNNVITNIKKLSKNMAIAFKAIKIEADNFEIPIERTKTMQSR